jgi:hypothetical protein
MPGVGSALGAASQLEKIGFVDFTVDLVKGVYECIVQASLEQLKAYADLVTTVAKTVTEYQGEVAGGDDTAQGNKADDYIRTVLGLTDGWNGATAPQEHSLTAEQVDALKQHFAGVTIEVGSGSSATQKPIEEVITADTPPPKVTHDNLSKFVIAPS